MNPKELELLHLPISECLCHWDAPQLAGKLRKQATGLRALLIADNAGSRQTYSNQTQRKPHENQQHENKHLIMCYVLYCLFLLLTPKIEGAGRGH